MRTIIRVGLTLLALSGCGQDDNSMQMAMPMPKTNPFAARAACMGQAVAFGKGQAAMVISKLQIAAANQGFDLDGDGNKDNKLGALASIANSQLDDTFTQQHNVVIPIEFFGATSGDSDCTKFAFYLGVFNQDRDKDGTDTNWETDGNGAKGDCNDTDTKVKPGQPEDFMNRMDDDCDGFADNMTRKKPPTDTMDMDGDGVSLADGDCDDRAVSPMVPVGADMVPLAKLRHPAFTPMGKPKIDAATERCDGIDYNCDGIPDNGPDCDPFGDADVKLPIQKLALDPKTQQPILVFDNGSVKQNLLSAGPSLFKVSVPISAGVVLDLEISAAHIEGTFAQRNGRPYLDNATLGGVLEAVSLARLDKIKISGILTPPQSLFDAVWASSGLSTVLMLKRDKDDHVLPDMDVDGDGIETFWSSNPDASPAFVDTCKDGDGTIIHNGDTKYPNDDPMKRCVFAKDDKGNLRFVDGVSAALRFFAVPARIGDLVDTQVMP